MRGNYTEVVTFHNACAKGNLKMVKVYLAQQGFDMNICDKFGYTGFHYACRCGKLNVVQFLIQQGFDINLSRPDGTTGFHQACIYGKLNVVRFLVQLGGFEGINEPNYAYGGMTGLQILIEHGDDYCLRDNEMLIPCLLLLIEAGAKLDKNDIFEELIPAIGTRIIEIIFIRETIFENWTDRIAQVITDFTMHPIRNTSLQKLSKYVWISFYIKF